MRPSKPGGIATSLADTGSASPGPLPYYSSLDPVACTFCRRIFIPAYERHVYCSQGCYILHKRALEDGAYRDGEKGRYEEQGYVEDNPYKLNTDSWESWCKGWTRIDNYIERQSELKGGIL